MRVIFFNFWPRPKSISVDWFFCSTMAFFKGSMFFYDLLYDIICGTKLLGNFWNVLDFFLAGFRHLTWKPPKMTKIFATSARRAILGDKSDHISWFPASNRSHPQSLRCWEVFVSKLGQNHLFLVWPRHFIRTENGKGLEIKKKMLPVHNLCGF